MGFINNNDGLFTYRGATFVIDEYKGMKERFIITESNLIVQSRGDDLEKVKEDVKEKYSIYLKK